MEETQKYNFIYTSFASEPTPVFKESKKGDWVDFGTSKEFKNTYPDYLIRSYNRSTKHQALVNGKADYIAGRGFAIEGENIEDAQRAGLKAFINSINGKGCDEDILKKVALDLELFNGFYLEVIWDDGKNNVSLNHMDFSHVRTNEDLTEFYFTSDWKSRKPEDNEDYKAFPAFDAEKKETSIFAYQVYTPNKDVYPLPSYMAALNYIETDYEIGNFHFNNISKGFVGSYIINFNNGQPTPEEQEEIEKQIKKKHTGTNAAGEFILTFNNGKENEVTVTPLQPSDMDDQFQTLEETVNKNIFIAHTITSPKLFGIMGDGGLGNNADELRTANELFQNRYVTPRQETLECIFNDFAELNGLPGALVIQRLEPVQESFSEATRVASMTKDEIRAAQGLEPLDVDTGGNAVAEALALLSPLVATKVLDNMSTEEVRSLIGLRTTGPVERREEVVTRKFSSNTIGSIFADYFDSLDNDDSQYEEVEVRDVDYKNELEFLAGDKATRLEFGVLELTNAETAVLNVVNQNPTAEVSDIAQATSLDEGTVKTALDSLESKGAITRTSTPEGIVEYEPTEDGIDTIESEPETTLKVMYRYVTRPGAPSTSTGSRPFCVALEAAGLINRDDMVGSTVFVRNAQGNVTSTHNNGMGLDVWAHRGGFYNDPSKGRTTSFCRHIWQQVIVRTRR